MRGRATVARLPHTQNVAGSNPVSAIRHIQQLYFKKTILKNKHISFSILLCAYLSCDVVQLVEHLSDTEVVAGSIPAVTIETPWSSG